MDINLIEKKSEQILRENKCFSIPVNIEGLVTNIGIKLEKVELEDSISGLFVVKNNKPYILYNSTQSRNRVRFTIAHELGHYTLHSKNRNLFIDKKKVLYRDNNSSTGEILMEREANAFAAAILMPKNLIQNELDNLISHEEDISQYLADKFNVSPQAMAFRLSNLGYDFGMF